MQISLYNKAIGAGAGATFSIPAAPQVWLWIEKLIGDQSVTIDGIGIAVLGVLITIVATFFSPGNATAS